MFSACCLLLLLAFARGVAEDEAGSSAARRYLAAYKSMEMADWLAERDMIADAVEYYREALRMFQSLANDCPGWESESVAYRTAQCQSRVDRYYVPAPALQGGSGGEDDALNEALNMERLSNLEGAMRIYSKLLSQNRADLRALKGATRCLLRMGSVSAARDLLMNCVAGPVSDSDLLVLMALVECHYQQFDRAIQLLRLALDSNPANAEAYVAMGLALAGKGRLDAAANEMKRAISFNTRMSEAYYNLAWISFKQNPKNIDAVRTHYSNALRYGGDPDPLLERLIH